MSTLEFQQQITEACIHFLKLGFDVIETEYEDFYNTSVRPPKMCPLACMLKYTLNISDDELNWIGAGFNQNKNGPPENMELRLRACNRVDEFIKILSDKFNCRPAEYIEWLRTHDGQGRFVIKPPKLDRLESDHTSYIDNFDAASRGMDAYCSFYNLLREHLLEIKEKELNNE